MAKSVTAVKNILKTEEGVLEKLQAAIKFIAHKETKDVLREVVKNKKIEIRCYKQIIKASEKCPAVKKATPAVTKKTRGSCKTTTKRGACKSRSTTKKATAKKKPATRKTTKKK